MNIEKIITIARKEFIEILYSKNEVRMVYPGLITPAIILPILIIYSAPMLEAILNINIEIDPAYILQYFINHIYPWFFMVGNASIAVSMITDSIAGEKERKTIERLLATPTDELTILLGKSIASWLYTFIPIIISFSLFIVSANIYASILIHYNYYILPSPEVIFILLVLSPILTLTLIGVGIIVSIKSKTIREANNISGFISFLVIIPSAYGAMKNPALTNLLIISLLSSVLCVIIFLFACKIFSREELIKYI